MCQFRFLILCCFSFFFLFGKRRCALLFRFCWAPVHPFFFRGLPLRGPLLHGPDCPTFRSNVSGCFRRSCTQNCTFGLSGHRVKPWRPIGPGRRRPHKMAQRTPNVLFRDPGASNTHVKVHEKTPERENTNETMAKDKKTNAKIWAAHPSGRHLFQAPPSSPRKKRQKRGTVQGK